MISGDRVEISGFQWRGGHTRLSLRLIVAVIWVTFTTALAVWWLIFGLRQISILQALSEEVEGSLRITAAELHRQSVMLLSEGCILVLLVLGGGIALLAEMRIEMRSRRRVAAFFAAFAHDVKTSLSSLRLQVESLLEETPVSEQGTRRARLLDRLLKDSVRIGLQIDNALQVGRPAEPRKERVALAQLLMNCSQSWPDLAFQVSGDSVALADAHLLTQSIHNLCMNSIRHGGATQMRVSIREVDADVEIELSDNGSGFSGDVSELGRAGMRPVGTSGSGLGLSLVKQMFREMGGSAEVRPSPSGFSMLLKIPRWSVIKEESP